MLLPLVRVIFLHRPCRHRAHTSPPPDLSHRKTTLGLITGWPSCRLLALVSCCLGQIARDSHRLGFCIMRSNASGLDAEGQDDLDEMMKPLGLWEDPVEATQWLAIVRGHMDKEFSEYWFHKNMRMTWDLAREVKFRSFGNNLFTS